MIEQKIDELIAAMDRLSVAMGGAQAPATVPAAAEVPAAPAQTPPPPAAPAAEPAPEVTVEMLNSELVAKATAMGDNGAAAMGLLGEFGIQSLAALPKEQYANFRARIATLGQ